MRGLFLAKEAVFVGQNQANDIALFIHQRPARIARLHRHADLKIARVIPRAGQ